MATTLTSAINVSLLPGTTPTVQIAPAPGSMLEAIAPNVLELNLGLTQYEQATFELVPVTSPITSASSIVDGKSTGWTKDSATGRWRSPLFDRELTLELHVQVQDSTGSIHHGSGYVYVRDSGGFRAPGDPPGEPSSAA